MTPAPVVAAYDTPEIAGVDASTTSGISWAAIFAGAAAAAALSLILIVLGFGLGFGAMSPWANAGASATAIGLGTAIWLLVQQAIASGLGGYLAGRLRCKWSRVHTDEVYFRDTAHGFLAWAVATLVTAAFLGSAITAALGTAASVAATAAGGAATAAAASAPGAMSTMPGMSGMGGDSGNMGYIVDSTLRGSTDPAANAGNQRGELTRIFTKSVHAGALDPADRAYVAQMIAAKTGIPQADAEKRVDDSFNRLKAAAQQAADQAKEAADKARKAAAYAALWAFIALLTGAFAASYAAIWGGRQRDGVGYVGTNVQL